MREKLSKKNLVYNLMAIPVLLYTIYLLFTIASASFTDAKYPNEYREAVNIQLTEAFMQGDNPYALDNLKTQEPGVFYLYGPVYSLFTACIGTIIPMDIFLLHYVVTFFAMLLSAGIAAFMVSEYTKTITAPAFAFVLIILCHWRYGYVNAIPDSFALCLSILVLFVLTRPRFRHKAAACAWLTVTIFFTKQYFVLIAGTVILYLLLVSKKEVMKYIFYCGTILSGCLVFIFIKCPLYLTYAIYFVKGPGSGVVGGSKGTNYNNSQIMYIGGMFICLFLVATFDILRMLWKRSVRMHLLFKEKDKPLIQLECSAEKEWYGSRSIIFDILFWIQMAVSGICMLYLGKNGGAWISYYLQLFMPSLIIVSIVAIDGYRPKKLYKWLAIGFYGVMITVTLVKTDARLTKNLVDEEATRHWVEAYDMLDDHLDGEIYYMPLLAFHGLTNGQYMYNTGQPFVITEKFYKQYLDSEAARTMFPYAGELFMQHLNFRDKILQKVRSGEYSLVTNISEADVIFTKEDLLLHYKEEKVIELRTGNQVWQVEFWTLKNE